MKQLLNLIYLIFLLAAIGCEESNDLASANSGTGIGGSFAQFTIAGDYLYVIDDQTLRAYDITDPEKPSPAFENYIGFGIETIFPYQDHLFIGSETGLQIFDISTPSDPRYVSGYIHVQGCDPVVVQGEYAYVTIRDGRTCGGDKVNQLDVVDISDLNNPTVIGSYDMFNPHGLGIDGDQLFVTEGTKGLKSFDVTNPRNLKLTEHLTGFFGYDVIPINDLLILIGEDGLYQYDYSDPEKLEYMSTLVYQ